MASADPGQTPSRPVPSCLDAATLQQLLDLDDGQTGLLDELFGLFKEDTPSRLEGIQRSLDAGDATGVSETAHALKGAAGTLGASRMRGLAADLERTAKGGKMDGQTAQWIKELGEAYAEACAALDGFIAGA